MHDDRSSMIGRPGQFPSTRWSLVIQAGSPATSLARAALAELCNAYWYPIYAFIRRQGNRHDEALDLTQSYFARLLEKPVIAAADQKKGRFRSFLKTDCQHFIIDQCCRKHHGPPARQRRSSRKPVPDRACRRYDPGTTPDLSGPTRPDRGLRLLAEEYEAKGQAGVFDCLKCVLVQSEAGVPVKTLAAQLGKTEGAVYTDVHRLKRRYREVLLRGGSHTR